MGAGTGVPADAALLKGFDIGALDRRGRVRPPRDRGHEARLRRPRGVLRRPRFRRRAARRRCSRRPTPPSAASSIGETAPRELAPWRVPGYEAQVGRDAAGPARCGSRSSRRRRRRADHGPAAHGRARATPCHLDVIDRWGNMISATPSGGWLQSSPVIPGLGFPLELARADVLARRRPALSLAPGKRPRTTLTPSLALRRRRAVAGLRHAGRRPAGPMAAAALPAPGPSRPEPAGGDRPADVPHGALPVLVLSARVRARPPDGRGNRRPRRPGRAATPRP